MKRPATSAAVVAVVLAFALSAAARDEDENAGTLDEVTVSARRVNESLDDPPVFVETIEMDRFAGRFVTTEEALSQAAGVTVRDFGGLGRLSTVSIRGSGADQVVVLVDGIRINPSAGGGVDLSTIPPSQIERIEVIRGGDSAFYGDGAMGGVVNIVTKRPAGEARNDARLTYGSFNTLQTAATRSEGFEKWGYLVSGSYLHSDGDFLFENNNGTEFNGNDDYIDLRENNETDNRGVLAKAYRALGERAEVSVQNEFFFRGPRRPRDGDVSVAQRA
ncbi:MAG: TonB-dependent receptor plug domain-containing protein [Deltaproteobacteria bacterium]|nr:TonB-dependent receptor plug domain-containing protein [Deltaproteobacteria bacterium]